MNLFYGSANSGKTLALLHNAVLKQRPFVFISYDQVDRLKKRIDALCKHLNKETPQCIVKLVHYSDDIETIVKELIKKKRQDSDLDLDIYVDFWPPSRFRTHQHVNVQEEVRRIAMSFMEIYEKSNFYLGVQTVKMFAANNLKDSPHCFSNFNFISKTFIKKTFVKSIFCDVIKISGENCNHEIHLEALYH